MSFNNIIAIIGDKYGAISLITSKLVLLRDLDKVVDTNLENAVTFLSQTMPNVIIVHAIGDSADSLNAIKDIKQTEILKNIPILLYAEDCTKEYLIDAFDYGIADIIKSPIADWELLIRVIWCIQKNEINTNIDSKNEFLMNLNILQEKTGFYTEAYAEQYLTAEINSAVKYKTHACLMLVGPDNKFPPVKDNEAVSEVIKNSIRLNDSVGIRKDGMYYIYLPKTKLNGAYAVFERMNNNLGIDLSINASVAEIKDKDFSIVKNLLEKTYAKTVNNSNTLLVAHEVLSDGSDFYPKNDSSSDIIERRKNIKEKLQKTLDGSEEGAEEYITPVIVEHNIEENILSGSSVPIEEVAAQIEEGRIEEIKKSSPALPPVNYDDYTEDEARNASLFRQAFRKKCELVLKPVFDKFKMQIQNKHPLMDVINSIEFNQSYFELKQEDKILRLTVNYPGFSKVDIITEIYLGEERRGYNAFDLGLTEFSFQKLSITLEGLINEYESYL